MAEVDKRNVILLDDLIDLDDTERILWTYEFLQIFPKEGKNGELITSLRKMQNGECWSKNDIPSRFNYRNGERVAPIICSAGEGRIFSSRERYADILKSGGVDRPSGGHGYDNDLISMRATFIAHGPSFRKYYVAEPFNNVDIYDLLCKILKIEPADNDGNFDNVKKMLR
jgi:predicted AlkP superfamily pyrophosphatase or phosphodiesterase